MAVTDQQKLDFLLKKIGYTKTKTGNVDGTGNPGEGSVKQPFAEAIPSPLVVPNSSLWNEADSIPATPPGSDTTQVKVYSASSAVRLTEDITVSTASQARSWIAYSTYNNTSSARLTNWIDTQFGAGYLIKVYNGDPNSGGTPLSAGATNQNWFFDYSAGVLNFNDDTCPVSPSDSIYIVGYRYIGQTGAPTSGISTFSYLDLTVERNLDVGVQGGISTFRNNIDLNADLDVDGHTNLDNLNVAGVTTFAGATTHSGGATVNTHLDVIGLTTLDDVNVSSGATFAGAIDANGDLDVDGHTELDNVNIVGVTTHNGQSKFYGNGAASLIWGDTGYTGHLSFDGSNNAVIRAASGKGLIFQTDHVNTRMTIGSQGNVSIEKDLDVDGHTNLDNVSVAGVSTFTGDATFSGSVSIGGTLTYEDVTNVDSVGLLTARSGIRVTGGVIEALADENKIPSLYANMAALPSAGSYHGMFAHVHSTGRGYFAHAGNWLELVNADTTGRVGTGTESYFIDRLVSTSTTATSLNVVGVSTFGGNLDINADLDVDGHTELDNANISGIVTAAQIRLPSAQTSNSNLSRFYIGDAAVAPMQIYYDGNNNNSNILIQNGTGGLNIRGEAIRIRDIYNSTTSAIFNPGTDVQLRYNNSLKFATTNTGINVTGNTVADGLVIDGDSDLNGDLDVDGHTNLDNVSIAGVSTFNDDVRFVGAAGTVFFDKSDNALEFTSDTKLGFGGNGILKIYHDSSDNNSYIRNQQQSSDLYIQSWGTNKELYLQAKGNLELWSGTTEKALVARQGGRLELYHSTAAAPNVKKLQTQPHGIQIFGSINSTTGVSTFAGAVDLNSNLDVDGQTELDNINISGVTTTAGNVDINADLDVDGHTNLDNVSIAGITTFSEDVKFTGATSGRDVEWDKSANYLRFKDNAFATFGNSDDLYIYHDGNHSQIRDVGTGHLILGGTHLYLTNGSGSEYFLQCIANNQVDLYFNNSIKLSTTNTGINVTGLTETDTLNTGNATFTGTITAGGATGTNGQYLKSVGTGVTWASFPTFRTRQTFTASAGQTTFSFTYNVNFIDVFVNGIKLTDSEFTATNGTSVVLAVGCFVGDIVELVGFNTVSTGAAGGGGTLNNIVEDTTPQLGGNLDLFSKTINGTGGINITGVVTATTFIGDGSGLTGIVASGSGVVVKNNNSTVGTAGTINFGDNLSVSAISAGIVTITGAAGITTAEVRANTLAVSGISTFSDNVKIPLDDKKLIVGADNDLELFHTGGNSIIKNTTSGSLLIHGNQIDLRPTTESGEVMLRGIRNAGVELRYDNTKRFEVTNTGGTIVGTIVADGADINGDIDVDGHTNLDNVSIAGVTTFAGNIGGTATFNNIDVDGHTELDNVNVAGVVTATTFKGAVQATSGTFSSGVDITGDLDVDGHTDLDNVSIAGVSTLSGNLTIAKNNAVIELSDPDSSDANYQIRNDNGTFDIKDSTNSTVKIRATSTNVTVYPNLNANNGLDVMGTITGDGNLDIADSVRHSGDINTKITFPANDTISFDTAGSERLRITSDGKMGLGTSSVDELLHVANTGGGASILIETNASSGGNILFGDNSSNTVGRVQYVHSDNSMRFHTNGTERLRITSDGKTQVGTGVTIEGNGQATYTGIITATKFVGDGSGLTGITASGSGVVIKHDGSTVGTAGTINFGTNLDVSAISGGAVTITASGGSGSGISTISGVVNIANDLDVDGHTNLDNVSVAGVVTATTFVGALTGNATSADTIDVTAASNSANYFVTFVDQAGAGRSLRGDSGIIYNPSSNDLSITGTFTAGSLDISGDIDVDGHTNLDNVSVAGVSTFSGGAGAATIAAASDIRFASGTWTGESTKIQHHNLSLYIQGGTGANNNNSIVFRGGDGTDRWNIRDNGHFYPNLDSLYDIGSNSVRVRNGYFDTLYGDGSNLTGVNANVGITTNLSGTFTASAGSPSTINTFGYGSGDIVVEYTVFIKNGSNFQSQKLLAMRDGTTIHSTQFAVMYSSSLLVQLDATISSGNILLRATPETGVSGSTTYKVKREVM